MKIKYNGEVHETKQVGNLIVSTTRNIVFGLAGKKLQFGEEVEITEVIPDETWKVADIKLWLDAQGISYTSSALKADLLALI